MIGILNDCIIPIFWLMLNAFLILWLFILIVATIVAIVDYIIKHLFRKWGKNMNISIEEMPREIARLEDENDKLQDRIDDAIKYINHYETIKGYYEYQELGYDEYNYDDDLKKELLEILKGSDKEWKIL